MSCSCNTGAISPTGRMLVQGVRARGVRSPHRGPEGVDPLATPTVVTCQRPFDRENAIDLYRDWDVTPPQRAIHSLSYRKAKPFIAVNCGALPESLLESELFGHVEGAFTGATKDRPGRFRQAEGGTIFLDEIGDVSPALQVRLLRVLQEREYEPVGAGASVKTDVRVVCATNKNLETLMRKEKFRQDLYYRVNVIRVHLPPLRERKEDIPLLIDHFIDRLNHLRGRDVAGVSAEVMARFMAHDWPGNARELENAIEHAFILCRNGLIDLSCLPEPLQPKEPDAPPPGSTLAEIEARLIYEALRRNQWKRQVTARELGIDKTTLWRKIKKLGIKVPED